MEIIHAQLGNDDNLENIKKINIYFELMFVLIAVEKKKKLRRKDVALG